MHDHMLLLNQDGTKTECNIYLCLATYSADCILHRLVRHITQMFPKKYQYQTFASLASF